MIHQFLSYVIERAGYLKHTLVLLNIIGSPPTFHLLKIIEAVWLSLRHLPCQDRKRVTLKEIVAQRRRDMELKAIQTG
jgi:hypothetical protein